MSSHPVDPARRALVALPLVQGALALAGGALAALWAGRLPALAFVAGALVVTLGQALFGWRTAWRPPVVPGGRAFARLLLGSLLKWGVIGAGLALAMTAPDLPAESVLAGALVALLAYPVCLPWLLR